MNDQSPAPKNRRSWDCASDAYQQKHGDQLKRNPTAWGVWAMPEQELRVLGDVEGLDILEFGCGGAQWALALKRAGAARVVGMDLSAQQLLHARHARGDVPVSLVQANAEGTPFRDESFDLVFCDHGAMTFARPEFTVVEAARLLRRGGRFAFNAASPLQAICWDDALNRVSDRLVGNYFELREVIDPDMTSYTQPYGEWIRLFRRNGLLVEDLIEPRPPDGADTTYNEYVALEWARRWPAEAIWVLTKT